MWIWILLVCALLLFLYLWNTRGSLTQPASSCNTCPSKKNVEMG